VKFDPELIVLYFLIGWVWSPRGPLKREETAAEHAARVAGRLG